MDSALKYHFNAAEREAYQKSTHCQNVTNHSSIGRHFMTEGNTLQSTGYWLVRHYNCLQITQWRDASTRSTSTPFHILITGLLNKSF